MYEEDEAIRSDEEVEFDQTAVKFQNKFRSLSSKFQQILLQESTLAHRTSELCQVQQLMIADLKNEMNELRLAEQEMLEEKPLKTELEDNEDDEIDAQKFDYIDDVDRKEFSNIKSDMTSESLPCEIDKFDVLKNENANLQHTFHTKQQQQQLNNKCGDDYKINTSLDDLHDMKLSPSTQKTQQFNGEIKHDTRDNVKPEDFEEFDIESEITPSFIMKKVENKRDNSIIMPSTSNKEQLKLISPSTAISTTSTEREKSFNDVYLESNLTQNLHKTNQQQKLQLQQQTEKTLSNATMQQTHSYANQHQHQEYVQQQEEQHQQEDDWLCIQKELNLINESKIQQQIIKQQTNDIFPTTTTAAAVNNTHINHIFPNDCLNNNQGKHSEDNAVNDSIGEFFDSTDDEEMQRSVETRLEAMFGESPVPLSGKNDSDSQDIESGLEEIFGNVKSTVGETGVSIIDAIKNKRLWENEMATSNNYMRNEQQQQPTQPQKNYYNNNIQQQYNAPAQPQQQQQQTHHIQLNCNNNPRWMQNMEAQFTDFNGMNGVVVTGTAGTVITAAARKRHWNSNDMLSNNDFVGDDLQAQEPLGKKLCNNMHNSNNDLSVSSASMSSASSSPMSHQHVNMQQQHEMLDAELLLQDSMGVVDNNNAGVVTDEYVHQHQLQQQAHYNAQQQQQFDSILMNNVDVNALQHQQQQINMQHYVNNHDNMHLQQQHEAQQHLNAQQQQQLVNNGNNVEFDDDISRHVQNAIDSILNLQNSESDSLPFSLDHSMGSLLGDSILDERQTNSATGTPAAANAVTPMENCQTAAGMNGDLLVNHDGGIMHKRRMHLVDDLSDCLISGASQCGDNASNIMLNHEQYQQQQQTQTMHTNLVNHQNDLNTQPQQQYHHLPQGMLHHQHNHHQQQQATTSTTTPATIGAAAAATTTTPPEVLNDFSCMVANIDEAVKSMMSS